MYDEETGIYYLNARYYDPKIARFLTEDTYRGEANDPLSLNLYTYCHNEPLMYTDPTGHKPAKDADEEKAERKAAVAKAAATKAAKARGAALKAAAEKAAAVPKPSPVKPAPVSPQPQKSSGDPNASIQQQSGSGRGDVADNKAKYEVNNKSKDKDSDKSSSKQETGSEFKISEFVKKLAKVPVVEVDLGPAINLGVKASEQFKVEGGGGSSFNYTLEDGKSTGNAKVNAHFGVVLKKVIEVDMSWTAKRNLDDSPQGKSVFYGIGEDPKSKIEYKPFEVKILDHKIGGSTTKEGEIKLSTENRSTVRASLGILRIEVGIHNKNAIDALDYVIDEDKVPMPDDDDWIPISPY